MMNIRVVVASAALFVALGAHAQTYPSTPITVIVPASPGSLTDYSARALSNKLAARLKQPVVVDNRPGANGQIALERVIAQKPDGYTLHLAQSTKPAGTPNLFKTLLSDPLTDFTALARVTQNQ